MVRKRLSEWRRRGSNEETQNRNANTGNDLEERPSPLAADWQRNQVSDRHPESANDPRLMRLIETWHRLPEHVQLAIEALCIGQTK